MVTVVCTGGEFPPSSLSRAWLDEGQRTIAADGGLELLKRLDRKADLWIGDGDSLQGSVESWSNWYNQARVLDREKDDSDTEAAVKAAVLEGASQIWILGGAGGRMDHWWSNLRMIERQPRITRWLTGHEEVQVLNPSQTILVKPGTVSVFPLGQEPWRIESSGLRWPLGSVDFGSWHSLSNECLPSGGSLTSQTGRFLILRPWPREDRE